MTLHLVPRSLVDDLVREGSARVGERFAEELAPHTAELIAAGQVIEAEAVWATGVDRILSEVAAEVRERLAELEVEGSE